MGRTSKRKREKWNALRLFPCITASLLVLYFSQAWAAEESYPNRPINMVVNMAPGGVTDTHVKIVGDRLAEVLGQPILRLHKPGGGGTLAASFVAKAKPDGYTLLTATSSAIILSTITKKVDFTWEDFIPLGIYGAGTLHLFVKADAKWKTLQEFVEEAKARPGQLKVSSYGKLTNADLVIEAFSRQAGIKLAHVPYKSCAEAVTALLGEHVDADFCTSSMGQVDAGAVRILAIAAHERTRFLPGVKTFRELGYEVGWPLWYSFCAPQKTPRKIVDILSNGMQEVFKRYGKEIEQSLLRLDTFPHFLDADKSMKEIRESYESTYKIAKELKWVGIEKWLDDLALFLPGKSHDHF